ncbi:UNVERIFIED_CONTAM: hypothetical protein FKN15_072742 [Acipenser sinensis]
MHASAICHAAALLLLWGELSFLCLAQYENWPYPEGYPEPEQEQYQAPQLSPDTPKIQLRLAGEKRKHNEGRVEVYYSGEWGTVCDDDFSIHAAKVVCRELGYMEAISWAPSSKYGRGDGRIWLDNVHCTGKEQTLAQCSSNGFGVSDCKHTEDVGVVCSDKRIPGFKFINTLTNNIEATTYQQRPSIEQKWELEQSQSSAYLSGPMDWIKVPRDAFQHLVESVPRCGKVMFARRRKHSYWDYSVNCTGNEAHLSNCKMGQSVVHKNSSCVGGMPVVVSCIPGRAFAPSSMTGFRKAFRQEQPLVRLKGGANIGEGRVEVLKKGEWGTICDDNWNLLSAGVVCRELGFGSAKEYLTGGVLGQGKTPVNFITKLEPNSSRRSLKCSQVVLFSFSFFFLLSKKSIKERRKPFENKAYYVQIHMQHSRGIVGNSQYWNLTELHVSSRLKIFTGGAITGIAGVWGAVPRPTLSISAVYLSSLCLSSVSRLCSSACSSVETWYWPGEVTADDVVMSGVKCSGTEMSLSHCQHHGTNLHCPKGGARFAAGVSCSETAPDLVLNSHAVEATTYIEDRPMFMLQCAHEENCLSSTAASTPANSYRRLLRFSSQIHNTGLSDFRPKAGRHSWVWHDCHRHYHSMEVFTHYDLLSLNGSKVAEGHKASFCLEDTECDEGISKRYECANFGEQGITVGCWDVYRHDIDCQWIDITDLKPGDYIFQTVINPNYEVAESDYSNNVMKCRCRYDGHRVWMYNCHTGGSFSVEQESTFPGLETNQLSHRLALSAVLCRIKEEDD